MSRGRAARRAAGHHRNHAILGHSEACVATHPSDMAVALAALGATVHVEGHDGPRAIPMPGLHRLPGDEPQRDTELRPGELVTAVELPALELARRSAYRKVRERASFAFALVSVAAALDVRDGVVEDCRIALGAVAHVPWRALRAGGGAARPSRDRGGLRGGGRRRAGRGRPAARRTRSRSRSHAGSSSARSRS